MLCFVSSGMQKKASEFFFVPPTFKTVTPSLSGWNRKSKLCVQPTNGRERGGGQIKSRTTSKKAPVKRRHSRQRFYQGACTMRCLPLPGHLSTVFRAVLRVWGPLAHQANGAPMGRGLSLSGVGTVLLCTNESGNAQISPNQGQACQIA